MIGVVAVVPSLVGYVQTFADAGSIRHRKVNGATTNVSWARFGGRLVAFGYSHEKERIEAREGSLRGPVIGSFTNRTTQTELARFFRAL